MLNTFAQHLKLATTDVEALLACNLSELLANPAVQQKLASLNVELLRQTLPTAGQVLAENLPPFYIWLKTELDVKRVPDSPDHATRWVVNFLNNQESLTRLVELHQPVPRPAMERSIPRLVSLFDDVEDTSVRQEWQTAIAALCLVLAVGAREADKAVATA
ncbi:hypothetical protein H6F90_22500 [Trichocoleus sp. FACHB-591]|uniref:hypothetical protein n=1 Tax=Trichocoleus sp. FACHB-591 TaxID=2692872 RepID=UPI00168A1275|nr:hypothetical protein [Trichocoleus sp. FACHB-591]MBD2097848.1 hypothetical protein [Trichocoleus sp. FACHB-591]